MKKEKLMEQHGKERDIKCRPSPAWRMKLNKINQKHQQKPITRNRTLKKSRTRPPNTKVWLKKCWNNRFGFLKSQYLQKKEVCRGFWEMYAKVEDRKWGCLLLSWEASFASHWILNRCLCSTHHVRPFHLSPSLTFNTHKNK